jgi:hypothetical protein
MGEVKIVRRIPMLTLYVTKQTISRPNTTAAGRLQNVARRQFEGIARGRRQRGAKLNNQGIEIGIARRCHIDGSMEWCWPSQACCS